MTQPSSVINVSVSQPLKKKRGRKSKAQKALEAQLPPPPPPLKKKRGRKKKSAVVTEKMPLTREMQDIRNMADKDLSVNQRIKKYMPLVEALAHSMMRHVPFHVDRKDMISEGYIGLIEAAKRFDPNLGYKFETFARTRITGAMYDWLRSLDLLPRSARDKLKEFEHAEADLSRKLGRPASQEEVAQSMGVPIHQYQKSMMNLHYSFVSIDVRQKNSKTGSEYQSFDLKDNRFVDPVNTIYASKFCEKVFECINELPERYRLILSLLSIESMNLKNIGFMLDYSPSTVRQMREKALQMLREKLVITIKNAR